MIGHSRGGSLITEISRILGTNGVWVDHLTTLDPHPLNNDGNNDFPVLQTDASAANTYQNVLFQDNYWQNIGVFLDPDGEPVNGAYNRQLFNLPGGYQNTSSVSPNHSNVHLWYHGTVDERNPASDTEAQITSSEFVNWYVTIENYGFNAGFIWSLIGGGNRTSTDRPLGLPSDPAIRDGYNQAWDFGIGQSANRIALPSNNGNWPNVIKFNLVSTNKLQLGQTNSMKCYYQWAQPASSNAVLSFYLDSDFNPLNGNDGLLIQTNKQANGASTVSFPTFNVVLNSTNASLGYHALYSKITGGSRTRYLYAPEIIQVLPAVIIASQPASQTVWAGANVTFGVSAIGVPTLKYQWKTNGISIALATNANLTVSNVTAAAAANYSCLVSNAFGNATSSNAALTVLIPDTTKPTLSITTPASGQRWSNAMFNVTGTANDNVQVSSVWYQVNGAGWNLASNANNWSSWTAQAALTPGTNLISAYAVDSTNNFSLTNFVSLQYVVTNQLFIRATGLGTVSPNYSNAWLEIGRNYSVTSSPAAGFVFTSWIISTNWIGGATAGSTNLLFMMQSNLTMQANFTDVIKPTLTISAPTAGQHMSNALTTVTGTASDNWKVSNVWYQLNGADWNLAGSTNGWTNWNTIIQLVVGTNKVNAYAVDLGGNTSLTNGVSFVSSNTFLLKLNFALVQPLATNGLNFSLLTSIGLVGQIQFSTNLINWSTLTNFNGTNGTLNFRDTAATNFNRRFYRAIIP